MRIEEAWNQAAETTGVENVSAEFGTAIGFTLIILELIWWFGLGLLIKSRYKKPVSVTD